MIRAAWENRHPPKLVAACESIHGRGVEDLRAHRNLVSQLKDHVGRWAEQSGIVADLWHVWDRHLPMTKIGSLVPVRAIEEGGYEDEAAQGVRILMTDPDDENSRSRLLVDCDYALAKQLSNSNLYMIRLYVHITGSDEEVARKRDEIERQIRHDLPDFPYTDV